jgi:hypothetical protein
MSLEAFVRTDHPSLALTDSRRTFPELTHCLCVVSRADGCPTERDEQLVRSTHLRDALGKAAKVFRAILVPHRRLGLEIIVLKKEPVFIQQLTVLAVEGRIAHFANYFIAYYLLMPRFATSTTR